MLEMDDDHHSVALDDVPQVIETGDAPTLVQLMAEIEALRVMVDDRHARLADAIRNVATALNGLAALTRSSGSLSAYRDYDDINDLVRTARASLE